MSFKSLIIFALVASAGRVMTAPLVARNPCSGTLCARDVVGDGHSGLARRLANFGGDNVTLSSAFGGSSVNPSTTSTVLSLPTSSGGPSSTPPIGSLPTGSPSPSVSSISDLSTDGTPQPTQPLAEEPVTITVISTVFLSATQPPASPPTVVSSSSGINTSLTVPGVPVSSTPILLQPSGIFNSVSAPQPSIFTTLIPLADNVPSGTVSSSSPTDQPTSTPTGIIFLPPT